MQKDLYNSMKNAIIALEKKYDSSHEEIVQEFLIQYKEIYRRIETNEDFSLLLEGISCCTTIYMQTSSNYSQDFLNKMWDVERIIQSMGI